MSIKTPMEIGKLYKCSKYYLLCYPTKYTAAAARTAAAETSAGALLAAAEEAVASKDLKCKIRFSRPNEIFMVIEEKENYLHVLFEDKQGWIIWNDWLEIEKCII